MNCGPNDPWVSGLKNPSPHVHQTVNAMPTNSKGGTPVVNILLNNDPIIKILLGTCQKLTGAGGGNVGRVIAF